MATSLIGFWSVCAREQAVGAEAGFDLEAFLRKHVPGGMLTRPSID